MPTKNKIPKGWEERKLGEVCNIQMGQSPLSENYNEIRNGLPLIQGNNDLKNLKTIERVWTTEITKTANIGDIIMTVRAPVGDLGFAITKVCIGRGVCAIKTKESTKFIFYTLLNFKSYWRNHEQGSTFSAINSADIKKLPILLPPLPEQKSIVEILETWDKMIEKLTLKIAVKKQIKTGLMQTLLTGKVRLSGFDEVWEEKKLGEVTKNITTGKLDANAMVTNGQYRFYTCAKDYYWIDKFAFDTEALLISGNGANVGYIHYFNGKFNAYQRTYILSKINCNIFYLKFYLDKYLDKRIQNEKRDGNTPYITMDTLTDMKLLLPPLPEQQTIAEVLTTCDSEIESLTGKLNLITQQKKYLLSMLITGEIRVPEFETLPDYVGTPLKGREPSLPLEGGARRAEGIEGI